MQHSRVVEFINTQLWPLSERVDAAWGAQDGRKRIGESKLFVHKNLPYLIHDSEPAPGLKIAEFCGEVMFPYHLNDLYDQLVLNKEVVEEPLAEEYGVYIDMEGRPEAIIDLKYGSAAEHFKNISTIKPLLKLMDRVKTKVDQWYYDPQVELENIAYHMNREGLDGSKAIEYFGPEYYNALRDMAYEAKLWRMDYWFEDQFMGHSTWALNEDDTEIYWVTPVMARNDVARKKLRIGNMMMLKMIESAYQLGIERINLGVDEMDYKNNFWNTRRVYRPGLRRVHNQEQTV